MCGFVSGTRPAMNLVWMPNNSIGQLLPAGETAVVNGNYSLLYAENTVHPLDRAPRGSSIILEFVDTEGRHWKRAGEALPVWH
jgi:hypothetical protein